MSLPLKFIFLEFFDDRLTFFFLSVIKDLLNLLGVLLLLQLLDGLLDHLAVEVEADGNHVPMLLRPEEIPGARFELLPEESHQPFQEVPEQWNQLVAAFWDEVEQRR